MMRLGAGPPDSGRSMQDLKNHAFFKGIDWENISSDQVLPFSKELTIERLQEFKKANQEDIFGDRSPNSPSKSSELKKEKPPVTELMRGDLQKRNPWF
jgi:hypothetical protein